MWDEYAIMNYNELSGTHCQVTIWYDKIIGGLLIFFAYIAF